MLRSIRLLAWTELRLTLRERENVIWMFVMPLVFMYFIGTITGGAGRSGSGAARRDELHLVVPTDAGFLADRIQQRLEGQDYAVERVAPGALLPEDEPVLVLPQALTQTVLAGGEAEVVLAATSQGLGRDYDVVRAGRAVYTTLADVVAAARAGSEPTPETLAALDAMPRSVVLDVRPAGERKRIPSGFEQTVPGVLVMFVMVALLTSGAVLLVIERNQGLLRRLASTPMPRAGIVAGKWAAKFAVGLVQIAFAMVAGRLLFGMDWGPDLAMVVAVLVAWALFCSALGMLLGNLVASEKQAVAIGILATNVMAALGGCWWPIEVTPAWMQSIGRSLPTGWAMDAMHRLISFQSGASSAAPHVVGLVLAALLLGGLAVRRFRFE